MISDLPCVLFAGGKSSRMGEDKSLLPFGGFSTLAEYQYRRLLCLFERVYLSSKDPEKFGFDAPVLLDPEGADFAPTAGFVSAFRSLKDERIMALSVDTPFVDASVFETLIAADNGECDAIIAKTASGTHPLCGIYRRSLLEEMELTPGQEPEEDELPYEELQTAVAAESRPRSRHGRERPETTDEFRPIRPVRAYPESDLKKTSMFGLFDDPYDDK